MVNFISIPNLKIKTISKIDERESLRRELYEADHLAELQMKKAGLGAGWYFMLQHIKKIRTGLASTVFGISPDVEKVLSLAEQWARSKQTTAKPADRYSPNGNGCGILFEWRGRYPVITASKDGRTFARAEIGKKQIDEAHDSAYGHLEEFSSRQSASRA